MVENIIIQKKRKKGCMDYNYTIHCGPVSLLQCPNILDVVSPSMCVVLRRNNGFAGSAMHTTSKRKC